MAPQDLQFTLGTLTSELKSLKEEMTLLRSEVKEEVTLLRSEVKELHSTVENNKINLVKVSAAVGIIGVTSGGVGSYLMQNFL